MSRRSVIRLIVFFLTAVGSAPGFAKQESESDFFESRIRPVLVEHCYECHNSSNQAEAELALDWRQGIRTETEHGRSVVPGKPGESLLLKVIKHQVEGLEMPEGGVKLEPGVIADFEEWIN
ncbi:xanthan lyase, partial [bacterium]|nr:xanthan lyase [bacterium]